MFHTVPPEERIDASDAEIVDVIHTAGLWVGTDGVVSKCLERVHAETERGKDSSLFISLQKRKEQTS